MKDEYKTKKELIHELEELRKATGTITNKNKSSKEHNPQLSPEKIFYKDFYEFSPVMYFTVDRAGTVLTVNPAGIDALGYSREELVGNSVFKVFYKDDVKKAQAQVKTCFNNLGRRYEWEIRKVKKDGTVIWVKEIAKTVIESDNKTFMTIACEDITERKEREEKLKENLEQLSKKNRYEEIISTVTRSVHSSIDLHDVLENAVEAMHKNIAGADNASIYFIEGDEAVIKAWRGYPDWFIKAVARIPKPKGFTWKVLLEGKLIYCPDVEKDSSIGALGRKVGTKSYASMPIKHGDKTIGSININSFKKNAFDNEYLEHLDIVANQIAIAISNARQTDALRESEERYRTLYDQSPIGVYIFNEDLIITNTNDRHAEILKATREQIIGTELRKIKDQTFIPLHEQALEGKSSSLEDYYEATCTSAELWLFVSIAPLRDGAGKIIGGMSVTEDITERKKAEIALRQSEEEYESLVNTVEGIVWEADPKTFSFTFVSRQAERILGYPVDYWTKDSEFWLEKIHPEDRDWVREYCTKATEENRDHVMEYRMVASDGRIVWLRDIVTVVIVKGEVAGLRGLMIDITDLKKAEDLLKESAEKYRALVEKVQDLIVESSADGKFLYISPNTEEAMGYVPEDLLGKSIFQYVHQDDKEDVFREFAKIVKEQTSGKAIFRFQHKQGHWKLFESTGNTYQTAEGEIRCVIVSRDITERKKLEEELFKQQNLESLGVLAGGIAHDFNNLLTSILGNISLSKRHLDPKGNIYGKLTEAENASLRAKDLTAQLLTFSKGGAPVKEFVHSLGDLIKDTANFAVSGSKVKCEFDFEDELWPAEIDEGQISQVIHNLIINADQSMPDGGGICIKLQNGDIDDSDDFDVDEGKYIKITIEDTGIGMPEDLKKKIFNPYFTTKQRGNGLGLTTIYSIVKNHGGHITVNSEVGVGTRFDVYIPAAEDAEGDYHKTPNILTGKGKILVMDDEEIVRNVAGDMIIHLGYIVDYATDGEEAIEKYMSAKKSGSPFDAIMMDLTIQGGMGGMEANNKLLEIDPEVRTIVSSGYSNDPIMSAYDEYGFKGVITKPYKIDELSKIIHDILDREE